MEPRDTEEADDLRSLVEGKRPDPEAILTHPLVEQAAEKARREGSTHELPGFGTTSYWMMRAFVIDGTVTTGLSKALNHLEATARSYADGTVENGNRATILLGPPASGKSTVAERLAVERGAALVDCDDAKAILPEFDGGAGALRVHEESQHLFERVLERFLLNGDDVVIPKVGADPSSIRKLIAQLRGIGYRVRLVILMVDYDEAVRRMAKRFIETGRLIDPRYMRAVDDRPRNTYTLLKDEGVADDYEEVDGNARSDLPARP